PLGFQWNSVDYSCPYDAVIPILYQAWKFTTLPNRQLWLPYKINLNTIFEKLDQSVRSPERFRDMIRKKLHRDNPRAFPWGKEYAAVGDVLSTILTSNAPFLTKSTTCPSCRTLLVRHAFTSHVNGTQERGDFDNYISIHSCERSVSNWIDYFFSSIRSRCRQCLIHLLDETYPDVNIHSFPPVLSIALLTTHIKIDHIIKLRDNDDQSHRYTLQGIVYFASSHFVSRIVDHNCDVWYNDGIVTKRKYVREKALREFT
ncbi:hypothetical protein SCHPADRAFT_809224, partial [Schizopora paradoxa]